MLTLWQNEIRKKTKSFVTMQPPRYILYITFLFLTGFYISCQGHHKPSNSEEEKIALEEKLETIGTIDSLILKADQYDADGNRLGQILTMKLIGKRMRDENRFDEAIRWHLQALNIAELISDTLEMMEVLNHLGTNYRRIGAITEASSYHIQALTLKTLTSHQDSKLVKKCRVRALNGLGNIYLSMNNYEQADTVLRMALAGEQEANNYLGQAINLANIGSIKEHLGQKDSAWHYYRESLKMNELCRSKLGISLCHTHFGNLYESDGDTQKALSEYQQAFDTMEDSHDDWHRLEVGLRIVNLHLKEGQMAKACELLEWAKATADRIRSVQHKAEVNKMYYRYYLLMGDTKRALDSYVLGSEQEDSVLNMNKVNEIQNKIVKLERDRRKHELTLAQVDLQLERTSKRVTLIALNVLMLLAVTAIILLWNHLRMRNKTHRIMQEAQHARETFFTNVTHEFRTPLTVILGMGQQLENVQIESMNQVRSAAKMIVRQGNSLLNLINQLLDISKVRSAVGEPKWRHGNIVAFIQMVTESFQPYAQSKRQELTYSHSLSQVTMDFVPDFVSKIVSNLLSNAIKYTPQYGKINLTVEQMQNGRLKIQVFDTGRGIDKQLLSHVFDTFVQGDNTTGSMGTGVGLSLVKMMVEAMDGTVEAESTEGEGSTFTVTLPIRHADNVPLLEEGRIQAPFAMDTDDADTDALSAVSTAGDQQQDEEASTTTTILIVEDNQDIAYYIGIHLKKYKLLYARDAAEGLQKAEEMMPDMIITDWMMPGDMDGLELCRRIRTNELTSHIPIIIVTAKTNEQDWVRGLEAGADAYLVKPFNSDELQVRVSKLIEQRRLLREKFRQQAVDETDKERQLTAIDRQFLNRLIDAVHALMPQGRADVESVADRMGLSRSQLNRKMMAITGQNSSTYIMRLRLAYAKRLLKSDVTMPIGDVAQRCGFDDLPYFSRIFKQQFEMTPSQYRKSE